MAATPRLTLSAEGRLAMTFAMQQALAILQMPQLELGEWIQTEIDCNPLLEEISRPVKKYALTPDIPAQESLHELLMQQIREHFPDPEQKLIAETILGCIDEKGFVGAALEEMAATAQIETVLRVMQTFEPAGIFARNLQECLLIQLRAKNMESTDTFCVVRDCFEDLIHGRYGLVQKKISSVDLKKTTQHLALLSLRPTGQFKKEIVPRAIADLTICQTDRGWEVRVNEEELPLFEVRQMSLVCGSKEEEETFRTWLNSGKWLQRSISRRRQILLQIGMHITRRQAAFLAQKGALKELSAQHLASQLEIHESTLSRALAGKYAETPLGLMPLHALLTSSPATEETKVVLRKLVAQENKEKPLTDDQISLELQKQGRTAARRTVAKYRKELKIGSASMRKYSHHRASRESFQNS